MYDGKRTASLDLPTDLKSIRQQLRIDPEMKKAILELAAAEDRQPGEQVIHLIKMGLAVASKRPLTTIEEPVSLEDIEQRRFLVNLNDEQLQFVREQAEQDFRNCADQIRWIVELAMRAGKASKVSEPHPAPIPVRSEPQGRRNGRAL